MRSTSRRLTDYELEQNARSLAPEPVVRRRTLPRRLDVGGMEHVRIVTPTSLADEMNGIKKPRAERIMQSTEKILNHELTELGLEEWIGLKDKSTNAEYKRRWTKRGFGNGRRKDSRCSPKSASICHQALSNLDRQAALPWTRFLMNGIRQTIRLPERQWLAYQTLSS